MALDKLEAALMYNEKSYEVNLKVYGPDDLNIANNYYLSAQIYMKLLKIQEAVSAVEKTNEIIDKKEVKNSLLFGRYRALKAKIYKLKNDNKTALKAIDEGLSMV